MFEPRVFAQYHVACFCAHTLQNRDGSKYLPRDAATELRSLAKSSAGSAAAHGIATTAPPEMIGESTLRAMPPTWKSGICGGARHGQVCRAG